MRASIAKHWNGLEKVVRAKVSSRSIAASGLVAAALLVGCSGDSAPTRPARSLVPPKPSFVISDGGRQGGTAHFFFLPPTVIPQPIAPLTFTGVFDPLVNTVARVCDMSAASSCGPANAIATFTPAGGTGGGPLARIRVTAWLQSYSAIWDTRRCDGAACTLDPAKPYRLQVNAVTVTGAEAPIGFADLRALTGSSGPPLDLANYSPIVPGLPYIIAFRIESGLALGATVHGNDPRMLINIDSPDGGAGFHARTVADANGDWSIAGVPFGEYQISFTEGCSTATQYLTVDATDILVSRRAAMPGCPEAPPVK